MAATPRRAKNELRSKKARGFMARVTMTPCFRATYVALDDQLLSVCLQNWVLQPTIARIPPLSPYSPRTGRCDHCRAKGRGPSEGRSLLPNLRVQPCHAKTKSSSIWYAQVVHHAAPNPRPPRSRRGGAMLQHSSLSSHQQQHGGRERDAAPCPTARGARPPVDVCVESKSGCMVAVR